MALRCTFVRFMGPFQSSKFQAAAVVPVGARGIAGKNLYTPDPDKPKPFPYWKRDFHFFWQVLDRTTLRFDENTKLICVEGSHAIGKSKFASELAEELNMVHVTYPRMDDFYINPYGFDLRKVAHLMPERTRPYDEKDFSRNPLGPAPGCADRMHIMLFQLKYYNHVLAIRHILNTGQGVVMEGSPFSDYAYMEAAFNQGWIHPASRRYYKRMAELSLHLILRPNLILYLDAPIEVVQKNIEARGNEWDKNSPVWTNKTYLNDIYNELKRNYLKKMQRHCRVLAYDWSTPGETDIVVEDIESLNMDNLDYYDDQQQDWRFHNEEIASIIRKSYTEEWSLNAKIYPWSEIENYDAENLFYSPEECLAYEHLMYWLESERFAFGFNSKLGDKNFWWKNSVFYNNRGNGLYHLGRYFGARPKSKFSEDINGLDYDDIMAARAAGQENVVLNHNRKVLNY